MTLSKQTYMKAITNNKTCCVSTYGNLLSQKYIFGKPILSPINLLNHFDK